MSSPILGEPAEAAHHTPGGQTRAVAHPPQRAGWWCTIAGVATVAVAALTLWIAHSAGDPGATADTPLVAFTATAACSPHSPHCLRCSDDLAEHACRPRGVPRSGPTTISVPRQ
jgi:hypothetical protein